MKTAWAFVLISAVVMNISVVTARAEDYPPGPDARLTTGHLCNRPNSYRYPEKIPYCKRNVAGSTKLDIFDAYIRLGYKIDMRRRSDYKIDHLIPLCAGGSNEVQNLWPEHFRVYNIVDPLEPLLCSKMAQGVLMQREAVSLVLRAKTHLSEVPAIIQYVQNL